MKMDLIYSFGHNNYYLISLDSEAGQCLRSVSLVISHNLDD